MRKMMLNPFVMLLFGLLIGFISRLLDIFTTNLGEIFSQRTVFACFGHFCMVHKRKRRIPENCERRNHYGFRSVINCFIRQIENL